MIKSIIIDDDESCIKLVEKLLNIYCPEVEVLATCNSIGDAVEKINKLKPDLILLDIELSGESGFDLFNFFIKPEFKVIFTTSYEKFAIQAIKSSCLDFILKPVDPKELVLAINKMKETSINNNGIPVLLNNISNPQKIVKRITVPSINEFIFIDVNQIICLEGEAKYTTIYTTAGKKIIASKNIGEYEEILNDTEFFRCHKGWIINLKYATKLIKTSNQIVMENGAIVPVSVRKRDDLVKLFGKA